MVIPKIGRGKLTTGARPLFREALGKTQIQLKTGSNGTRPPSLHVLHPKGVSISRHDVSVGKTWGTDLVAAARRDARFVPFRLLTGMSSSAAPMFAMVGARSGRTDEGQETKDGGRKPEGLSLMAHLTHEDHLVISREDVTHLIYRIRRSTPEEIPQILLELVLTEEYSPKPGLVVQGLAQGGLFERVSRALGQYGNTLIERLTLTIDTLREDHPLIKARVQDAGYLTHIAKRFETLLNTFQLPELSARITVLRTDLLELSFDLMTEMDGRYPLPRLRTEEVLEDRYSAVGNLVAQLYATSDPAKIAKILSGADKLELTKADWNLIQASNPQIPETLHKRLSQIEGTLLPRSVGMAGAKIETEWGKQRLRNLRELIAEGHRLVSVLSALGTPRGTRQPHQYTSSLGYYEDSVLKIVGSAMGDIVFDLTTSEDPEQILRLLEKAQNLTPTDAEWKNIADSGIVHEIALGHATHLLHVVNDAAARLVENVKAERGQFLQLDVEEAHQRFREQMAYFKTYVLLLEKMGSTNIVTSLREVAKRRSGDVYAAMTSRSYVPSPTGDLVRQLRQADSSYAIIHILRTALRQELSADEWSYLLRSDSRIPQAVDDVIESTTRSLWGFRELIESRKSQPIKEKHSPLRGEVENAIRAAESTAKVFERMGYSHRAHELRGMVRLVQRSGQGLF